MDRLLFWSSMFLACRACAGLVRADAQECPHCGTAHPAAQSASARGASGGNWQDHFEYGLELIGTQQYAAALAEFNQAIVAAPDDDLGKCYAARGYANLLLGSTAQAIEDCTQGIGFDATDGEAFAWRGSAYAAEHQWRAALDDYATAIALSPDSAAEYVDIAKKYATQAIAEFTATERAHKATAQVFQDRGLAHMWLGQFDAAARDFTHSIKLNHHDALSFAKRAECHSALGMHERVIADCKAAMSLGTRTHEMYLLRANAQRHVGHVEHAIADFTKALELNAFAPAALFARGQLHQQRGEYPLALRDIDAAVGIDGYVAEYHLARAEVNVALGRQSEAADDYGRALELAPDNVVALLARGEALLKCDRADEALAAFDDALACDAASAPAFRGRGLAYAKLGQPDAASAEFSKAIRLNSRYGDAFASRGEAFLEQQRYDQAIADLGRAIELTTSPVAHARLHYLRGLAYLDVGKPDRAAADFDRSLVLRPLDPDTLAWRGSARGHLRQWRAAIDDLLRAIELNPAGRELYEQLGHACAQAAVDDLEPKIEMSGSDANLFLDRAIAYDLLGESQTALYDYNASIKLQPLQIEGFLRRGKLLACNAKHEHAANDFSRVLKIDSKNVRALHGRAVSRRQLGKLDEALADLNLAIEFEPAAAKLHHDRAVVLAAMGQHEQALAGYKQSIQLEPKQVEVYYERGLSLAALGKVDAAIADFNRVLEAEPLHARALHQRGEAHVQAKRLKPAVADFEAALAIDPALIPAHTSRALTLARLGQHDRAILELTKSAARIKADPAFAALLAARARIYYSLGRFQHAAHDYTLVMQLRPTGHNYPLTLYGRGLAMLQLRKFDSAEKNFAKAVELNPQFRPAVAALEWLRSGDRQKPPAELQPPQVKYQPPKPPVVGPQLIIDTAKQTQWQTEPLWDQWIVRKPDGTEFGPVQKAELDRWSGEGRLLPSFALLRLDWPDWRTAGDIYFELAFETLRSTNRPVPVRLIPEEPVEEFAAVDEVEEFPVEEVTPDEDTGFPQINVT